MSMPRRQPARCGSLPSDLLEFGIVDTVIQEPLGGAHRDPHQMAARLKIYLVKTLRELLALDKDEMLLEQRYEKFRHMGVFLEEACGSRGSSNAPIAVLYLPQFPTWPRKKLRLHLPSICYVLVRSARA